MPDKNNVTPTPLDAEDFSIADFADSLKSSVKKSRRGMNLNNDTEKIISPIDEDQPAEFVLSVDLDSAPKDAPKPKAKEKAKPAAVPDEPPVDSFLDSLYGEAQKNISAEFDSLKSELGQLASAAESNASKRPVAPNQMEDIFSDSSAQAQKTAPRGSLKDAVNEKVPDEGFSVSMDGIGDGESDFEREIRLLAADKSGLAPADYVDIDTGAEQKGGKSAKKKKSGSALIPGRNDSIGEIFRKSVMLVAIAAIVVCLGIIGNTYLFQPWLNGRRIEILKELPSLSPEEVSKLVNNDDLGALGDNFENLLQYYAVNKDFYGLLKIPQLDIKLPVVQGKDNTYYLKYTFEKKWSKYGCPYVNYQNSKDGFDMNTTIFGHTMEYDNKMFGPLKEYRKIEGFKKAPVISFDMLRADYRFKVYAVYIASANVDSEGYFFNYIFTQLSSESAFMNYIREIDQRKIYSTGVDIRPDDKLLTLSTCTYDFTNARLVIVARLVREGENPNVDVSKAATIANPRYPAEYYRKKGVKNPYANASKWKPE